MQILSYVIPDYPTLLDPIRLVILVGVVFFWLYCVQHVDRHMRSNQAARSWINLAVLLGGPPVWILAIFTRKILQSERSLSPSLSKLAYLLGIGSGSQGFESNELLVELLRSDGRPLSARFGSEPVKQAEAMTIARRIVHRALLHKASDILLDPKAQDAYEMRYRVDGIFRKPEQLDPELALAVVNCFKILSGMDISERRRSQDGACLARNGEIEHHLRTATASTVYGEKVAIRVLSSAADLLPVEQIGLPSEYLQQLKRFLARSHGMMVTCGPTGSGKTTTLYATLGALANAGRNIITIEDPVEYTLPFASQTGINPKAGITFATQLRHVLRQAPDVILVGEIRDAETARIALQSAETGHLVFSTLHANDAVSGLIRLVDLGIEPYLVGAGLNGLLAQRLVRKICQHCCKPARISPRLAAAAASRRINVDNVLQAVGCPDCGDTGYKGRMGIFQMLEVTNQISEALIKRPALSELTALARSQGMTTMRQDGFAKVLEGKTTIDEILRVTVD